MKQIRTVLPLMITLALVVVGTSAASSVRAQGKEVKPGVLRAVVKLMTPFEFSKDAGTLCSGTVLNQDGYILTNFHCVGYPVGSERDRELERAGLRPGDLYNRQGTSVVAIAGDPRRLPVPTYVARVVAADPELDLAVLKITSYINGKQPLLAALPLVSLPLADSDTVNPPDEILVIGYPGSRGDTVAATAVKIASLVDEDEDGYVDWVATDLSVMQGGSGGAAVNTRGELVGISTGQVCGAQGLIRPINRAVMLIERAYRAGETTSSVGDAAIGSGRGTVDGLNFGPFTFGAGFKGGDVTDAAPAFAAQIGEVHAAIPYQAMRDGMRWAYTWQLDGKTIAGESELKWQYGPSGVLDIFVKSRNGLPDGAYRLQLSLDEMAAQEGQFVIGDPHFKNTPQKPNAADRVAGVTITGSVIDHSTRKPIQGAAIAFLLPGKTVRDYDADNSKGKANTVQSYGVTDANGIFTADSPLARAEVYSVIVSARGYERIAENRALAIDQDEPDIIELNPIEMDRR